MFADLIVDLLVAQIGFRTDTGRAQRRDDLFAIGIGFADDRGYNNLTRGQPERQFARVGFDQDTDEPLERAQNRTVQHYGAVLCAIFPDVVRIQSFGQNEIDLQGAALPITADGVGQHEFQFRTIEGTFAGVQVIIIARRLGGVGQRGFCFVPNLVGPCTRVRTVREFHREVSKPEIGINRAQEFDEFLGFAFDLAFAAEDVRVILCEPAHAHDPVQCARGFITVTRPELGHAQRQITIGFQPLVIDLHVARAIHGFQCVDGFLAGVFFVNFDDEHVFLIFVPVARGFPQFAIHNLGRVHFDIPAAILLTAHVVL